MPIATNDIFNRYWLPACYELGLRLIPLFETGYPVIRLEPETIPLILNELSTLKLFFSRAKSAAAYKDIIGRIERLIHELNYLQEIWDDIAHASLG